MTSSTAQLIRKELLRADLGNSTMTINRISSIFINKELVQFINRIIKDINSIDDQYLILSKIKKILIQFPRNPDPAQLRAEKAEFAQFFKEIKREQKAYNPINWIDAELEYIRYLKTVQADKTQESHVLDKKEWLTSEDMLKVFKCSISSLNRRIADGMPCNKMGGKKVFKRTDLNEDGNYRIMPCYRPENVWYF